MLNFFDFLAGGIALASIALIGFYTLKTGNPPVPTSPKVKKAIIGLVPQEIAGTIFELGSGWGGMAFFLAERFPHCKVEAYEISPLPWLVSRVRKSFTPRPNLHFHRADFFKAPLGRAALVLCYLAPKAMERLGPKLKSELGRGAVVLSHTFAFREWQPESVVTAEDLYRSKVYRYRR
jgi:hypothetical protein